MHWVYLAFAILFEVAATTAMRSCESFTKLWPSVIVICGYSASFYFMSLTVKHIPLAFAYAIWCGVGIILIAILGWGIYGQSLSLQAILAMTLIISGIVLLKYA